jgi:hypothetical protein
MLTGPELLAELPSRAAPRAPPFADDAVAFCSAASEAFAGLGASSDGAWAAAAFFFRPPAIAQMRRELVTPPGIVRASRGVVFHVAPGNVETQFIYTWLISVLAGNANVVRLSSKLPPSAFVVCDKLSFLVQAEEFRRIRESSRVIAFGHDRATLDLVSRRCDLRVLWGGDAAIEAVRTSPLRPDAREITFPDRLSLCLIGSARFAGLATAEQRELARAFVSDAWTFDQLACSSPRALVWWGSASEAREASETFLSLVQAELEARGTRVPLAAATEKMRIGFGAIGEGRALSVRRWSNELVVVAAENLSWLQGSAWAPGLIVQCRISTLGEMSTLLHPGQQTLTYGALDGEQLADMAAIATSHGLCRVVPIGRALVFSRTWDGMDLLNEMTRLVTIDARSERR